MATPKRSDSYLAQLYRMGVGTGKPPKYKSPEELRDRINAYFAQIQPYEVHLEKDNEVDAKGNVTKTTTKEIQNGSYATCEPVPTISGLALFLGFAGRQALHKYEQIDPEYGDTIRAARAVVERYHEIRVATNDKAAGSIFLLQSMGYSTKAEVVHSGDRPKQTFKIGNVEIEF